MRCIFLPMLWLFASPLAAQPVTHACAAVPEPAARLACYDEVFPLSAEVRAASTEKAKAHFGLMPSQDRLRNSRQAGEEGEPERIEGRVTKVDHGHDGQRIFTLENGQVWAQTEARSSGHVQVGQAVQVKKAVLGGYHLVMANGVVVRVRRTR